MTVVLIQLGLWLSRKLLVGALIVAVGLGVYGLYLYLSENVRVELERQELVERLQHELAASLQAVVDLEEELKDIEGRIDQAHIQPMPPSGSWRGSNRCNPTGTGYSPPRLNGRKSKGERNRLESVGMTT